MVEGGRLEIVLAVLNRYVGSNPTLSANSRQTFSLPGFLDGEDLVNQGGVPLELNVDVIGE